MSVGGAGETSGISRRRQSARRERSAAWLERHDEILRAAAAVFRAKGFQATNITDIAQRLGINQSNVYYYFGKKEEMFLELIEQAVEENVGHAERAAAGVGSAAERLGEVVESLADSYDRHFPFMQLYVQEDVRQWAGSDAERYLKECGDRYHAAVLTVVRQGIESGEFGADLDPGIATLAVLGAVNWMHRWFVPDGALSGARIGRYLSRIVLGGLVGPAAAGQGPAGP
ncbi:MAG TPA: TetR/AcrR family transcriptional regulator [Pseudonocardia sp.]